MEISINGKKRSYPGPLTVEGLLEALNIQPQSVVVERNLKIVSRVRVAAEPVEDGDTIEIIRLVGGG